MPDPIIVPLSRPIDVIDQHFTELKVREPTGLDLMRAGDPTERRSNVALCGTPPLIAALYTAGQGSSTSAVFKFKITEGRSRFEKSLLFVAAELKREGIKRALVQSFKSIRKDVQKEMSSIFDRPTPWALLCEATMADPEYRFTIRPLAEDEGGGYLIEYPDLPGCISDGETIEDAIGNGRDAQRAWIAAMHEAGRPVPPPTAGGESYSGKWQLRTPKSLHQHLAERARKEGVSLNTLAVTLLAQGLGERAGRDA